MKFENFKEDTSIEDSCKMIFAYTNVKDVKEEDKSNYGLSIGMEFRNGLLDTRQSEVKNIRYDIENSLVELSLRNGEISKKIIREAIANQSEDVV